MNVELLTSQFLEVSEAKGWKSQETKICLRASLKEEASEYSRLDTTYSILAELIAQYGITPKQSRDQPEIA